ncbi:MAG: hypothetical protein ABL912_01730 [Novosphingobium sp.]
MTGDRHWIGDDLYDGRGHIGVVWRSKESRADGPRWRAAAWPDYDGPEDPAITDKGFDTRDEAVSAVEAAIDSAVKRPTGNDPVRPSTVADAVLRLSLSKVLEMPDDATDQHLLMAVRQRWERANAVEAAFKDCISNLSTILDMEDDAPTEIIVQAVRELVTMASENPDPYYAMRKSLVSALGAGDEDLSDDELVRRVSGSQSVLGETEHLLVSAGAVGDTWAELMGDACAALGFRAGILRGGGR